MQSYPQLWNIIFCGDNQNLSLNRAGVLASSQHNNILADIKYFSLFVKLRIQLYVIKYWNFIVAWKMLWQHFASRKLHRLYEDDGKDERLVHANRIRKNVNDIHSALSQIINSIVFNQRSFVSHLFNMLKANESRDIHLIQQSPLRLKLQHCVQVWERQQHYLHHHTVLADFSHQQTQIQFSFY